LLVSVKFQKILVQIQGLVHPRLLGFEDAEILVVDFKVQLLLCFLKRGIFRRKIAQRFVEQPRKNGLNSHDVKHGNVEFLLYERGFYFVERNFFEFVLVRRITNVFFLFFKIIIKKIASGTEFLFKKIKK
jgi:hypothetical protein